MNQKQLKYRNYVNCSLEELKSDEAKIDWSQKYDATNVESAVYFTSSLQITFNNDAPQIEKRMKGKPCPWLDTDTKNVMNRCNKTMKKARISKSNDWKSCKTLRNKLNNKIKKAKSNHHKEMLNNNINNPKKFWSEIKKVFPGNLNLHQT